MTIDEQREAFEAWMVQHVPQAHLNRDGEGRYIMYYTERNWHAWMAGFDAATEHALKNSVDAALLAALCDIVKRNEIQHWFNLDQAKAAIAHVKKTERPCGYCTPPTFKGWQNGKCPYCGKTKTPIESITR